MFKTFPSRRTVAATISVLALTGGAAFVSGCGDDDGHGAAMNDNGPMMSAGAMKGAAIDLAFAEAMIPHHESAIEMAQIAKERSKRSEITGLAGDIVRTQTAEIEQLRAIVARLEKAGVEAGSMGMSDHDMGMDGDTAGLRTANPFDRAFLSGMIPHHEGAVMMSRMVLTRGADEETRALARSITAAQQAEIGVMRGWLADWYGTEADAMSGSGHMG